MTDFALFDTPIGPCGIAWGARGVVGVHLPEATEQKTRARLKAKFADANESRPNGAVARAIASIVALLRGQGNDLSAI